MAEELQGLSVTVEWTELRARCEPRVEHLLRTIGLPNPWDINEFCDRLERHRGRDIDLVPVRWTVVRWTVGESTGAWQRRDDYDIIGYAENTSSVHQDHIILHEIGHVISEHRGRCVLSVQEAQQRAPHLAPAAFAHLLDRVSVEAEEHEAETIATMILARIARQSRRGANASSTRAPRQR
ncbi:hypothetical protein [Parasphingorhabdus pacifica]